MIFSNLSYFLRVIEKNIEEHIESEIEEYKSIDIHRICSIEETFCGSTRF